MRKVIAAIATSPMAIRVPKAGKIPQVGCEKRAGYKIVMDRPYEESGTYGALTAMKKFDLAAATEKIVKGMKKGAAKAKSGEETYTYMLTV